MARGRKNKKGFGANEASAVAVAAAFGALVLAAATSMGGAEATGWRGEVTRALKANNFGWISLDVRDGVAFVSGIAPDVDSRAIGMETVREQLRFVTDPAARAALVVDATTLDGADVPAIGAPVAALPAAPTPSDCQTAFEAILQGRAPAFTERTADLALDDPALLDTLAAAAIRCRAHPTEIAVRADAFYGGTARRLSQQRADALKAYLVERGAPGETLTPVGYGRVGERQAEVAFAVRQDG